MKDHLSGLHADELYKLSDDVLRQKGLFVCRKCGDYVAQSEGVFLNHLRSKHVKTRSKTNLDIVSHYLYHLVSSVHDNHWAEGLQWLANHTPSEPSFRQSLISKIKYELEDDITDCFEDVLNACVKSAMKPGDETLSGSQDFDPEPIWLLPFIFEQLVLCPNPDPPREGHPGTSLRKCITRRLRLFCAGKLQLLYQESQQIQSTSAKSFRSNPPDILKCAQEAADNDNFKSAYTRIVKHMPVAPINDDNRHILQKLFPASLQIDERNSPSMDVDTEPASEPPRMTTRAATVAELTKTQVIFTPQEATTLLRRLCYGKAPGVQVDSIDLFLKLSRRRTNENRKKKKQRKYTEVAKTFAAFFTIVVNGDVGPKITKLLRTTYTVALQKDKEDLTKLRPLGIPSAIRRIAASMIVGKYRSEFAKLLLPTNYAIGVSGGIDIITNSIRLGVEKFITNKLATGELPTCSLVSLDIRNMFNAVSREKL